MEEVIGLDTETQQRVRDIIENMQNQKEAIEKIQATILANSASMVEANEKLASVADELRAELERVRGENEEERKEIAALRAELDAATKELDRLKTELTALKQSMDSLTSELDALRVEKSQLEREVDRLTREQAESTKSESEKSEQIRRLEAAIAQKDAEITQLREDLRTLQAQFAAANDEVAALKREKEEMQRDLQEKIAELADANRRMAEVVEARRLLDVENAQLKEELEKEKQKYVQAEGLKGNLDQKLDQLQKAIKVQLNRIYDEKRRLIDEPVKALRAATDTFTEATNRARERAELAPRAQAAQSFLDVMGEQSEPLGMAPELQEAPAAVIGVAQPKPRRKRLTEQEQMMAAAAQMQKLAETDIGKERTARIPGEYMQGGALVLPPLF